MYDFKSSSKEIVAFIVPTKKKKKSTATTHINGNANRSTILIRNLVLRNARMILLLWEKIYDPIVDIIIILEIQN